MSVALYQNGIIEEFKPKEHTFSDQELIDIFDDYQIIRSKRLDEVPNTWCVWGDKENVKEDEYSGMASFIVQEDIFSIIIFIHDTEINQSWKLTDEVIYKNYNNFKVEIMVFIDKMAQKTIEVTKKRREEEGHKDLIYLETMGSTDVSKKIIFELDPTKQDKDFYEDENFKHFAQKSKEFLTNKYKIQDVFYIYEDGKMKMYVPDKNVEIMMRHIIQFFEKREKYEKCKELQDVLTEWKKFKKKKKENKKDNKNNNKNNNKNK